MCHFHFSQAERGPFSTSEAVGGLRCPTRPFTNDVVVSNIRHYEALSRALEAIHRVQDGLTMQLSGDLVSQDLRECLFHLAEIVGGEITNDEVLGNIFKHFCIGK